MATLRKQVSELQEFGTTYQEKFSQLQGLVQSQQGEIIELQRQLLDVRGAAADTRMPLPSKFNGDRRQYRGFLNPCRIYFRMHPAPFSTDEKKVLFIVNLLTDEALAWASPYVEVDSHLLHGLDVFITAMSQVFDDPNRCATAEARLHSLQQGRRSVAEYAAEFRRWVSDTNWNPAAQRSQFRRGLSEAIKDELARLEAPDDLDDFIQVCVRIDQRLTERRKERLWSQGDRPTYSFSSTTQQVAQPPIEPMQVDAVRKNLSVAEKERRLAEGLCLYCGEPGHIAIKCPNKSRRIIAVTELREQRQAATPPVTAETTELAATGSHFIVPIVITIGDRQLLCSAMLDSGAGDNFMDLTFAHKNNIPLVTKIAPIDLETVDGSPLSSGPVTHQTADLQLHIKTDHHEMIHFSLIASPKFPVILGIPWLATHNPSVDWETRCLQFTSEFCSSNCLHEPASPTPKESIISKPTVKELLPPQYSEFQDVCEKKNADKLPPHRPYDCPIELLPGAEIPFGSIYSLSEPELKALKDYLDEDLKKGFIRPSTSPAGAPFFFVEKKDSSLRPCIDYRKLNDVTVKNRYPLPLISELLERLRAAKIFTKLDLRGAYNLVRIRPGDEWKTAFRTRYGHFEYLVMPFGLCNAPATFQHFINDVLRDMLDLFVVVYLDDILIFSENLEQHREHVCRVLQRLREQSLYIKLEKCEFEQTTTQFLGYIISPEGLSMDPRKIQAVIDWPPPKNEKEIQRFVGFANFYRKFIRNFSKIITPITQLTKKTVPFSWTPEAQEAFIKLKSLFTSAPILIHPNPELPFTVEVDASDTAVGAVLSQRTGEKMLLHPCAFFSRQMSPAERNYDIGNKELLAIKDAFSEWRHLLEGAINPITVFTDHRNLEFIRSAKRLNARQARWSFFFSRFNFIITYRPGSKNGKADALSRMFSEPSQDNKGQTSILPEKRVLGATYPKELLGSIKKAYEEDPFLTHPAEDVNLTLKGGFWVYLDRQLYVPEMARLDVLKYNHDTKLAGHPGTRKTQELLSRSFWWPTYKEDTKKFVSSCTVCARNKTPRSSPVGLLQPLPIPSRPWGSISMDFVVDLPPSKGMNTILVVVDRLTKMAHFIPCKGLPTAKQTADLVFREIFRLHGVPDDVVSDRGVQFTSKFWKDFCLALGITVNLSSAFHPQSNGQTERTNQTLEQYLLCFITHLQDDWLDHLPTAEFSYNNAEHSSTHYSPFYANTGLHPAFIPRLPITSTLPAVAERLANLQEAQENISNNLLEAQRRFKRATDKRRRPAPDFQIGDQVWLSTRNLRLKVPAQKLGQKYMGPFRISGRINEVTFRLDLPHSIRVHPVFHCSLLKPFVENTFPGRHPPPPPPVRVQGEEEYIVSKILDSRLHRGKIQYLISWKGYPPEDNSWEPEENIHAPRLVREFHLSHPDKPSPAVPGGHLGRGGVLSGLEPVAGHVPGGSSTH